MPKRSYLLVIPAVLAAMAFGWFWELVYYNRQMSEVCGVEFFDVIFSYGAAVDCLIWRDQAKIWLWPIIFGVIAFLYLRWRLTPPEPKRKWGGSSEGGRRKRKRRKGKAIYGD